MAKKIMFGVLPAWIIGAVLTCQAAPPELIDLCIQAKLAWVPYYASVQLRWCKDAEECEKVGMYGGGIYNFVEKVIVLAKEPVDRQIMHPYIREMGRQTEIYLLLLHEYGHALGLNHSNSETSIMRPGWDWPLALDPAPEDFAALKLVH